MISEQQLAEWFALLRTGSAADIAAARKAFEQAEHARDNGFCDHRAFFFQELERVSDIAEPRNRAAVVSVIGKVFLFLLDHDYARCVQFVLNESQHSDGRVRQAARTGAMWLRVTPVNVGKNNPKNDQWTQYTKYIETIELLLTKYRPPDASPYIEDLKPSVYKSLALLWHDGMRGMFAEEHFNPAERMHTVGVPRYTWMEEEHEDNYIDPEEIAATLWNAKNVGNAADALPVLEDLANTSRVRFEHELERIGFAPRDRQAMAATLKVYGPGYGPNMLMDIAARVMEDPKTKSRKRHPALHPLDCMNGCVRALQGMSNHLILHDALRRPGSPLLYNAAVERAALSRNKPDDWVAFLTLVRDAHAALEEYMKQRTQTRREETAAWLSEIRDDERLSKVFGDVEEFAREHEQSDRESARCDHEALSIAHHMLDWYVQVAPYDAVRKDAKKLAAVILCVLERVQYEAYADDEEPPPIILPVSDLASWAGWKSSSSVTSMSYGVYNEITEAVNDPDLLLMTSHLEAR